MHANQQAGFESEDEEFSLDGHAKVCAICRQMPQRKDSFPIGGEALSPHSSDFNNEITTAHCSVPMLADPSDKEGPSP